MQTPALTDSFVPFPQVKATTGLSRTTVYELIQKNAFPRPIKIGAPPRWSVAELQEWLEKKRTERDSTAQAA